MWYKWMCITIRGLDVWKQLLPPLVLLKDFANIEHVEADLAGNFLNKTVRCIINATDENHMSNYTSKKMTMLTATYVLQMSLVFGIIYSYYIQLSLRLQLPHA